MMLHNRVESRRLQTFMRMKVRLLYEYAKLIHVHLSTHGITQSLNVLRK